MHARWRGGQPRRAKAKSQRAAEAFDEGDSESDESDVEEEEDEAADIVLKQVGARSSRWRPLLMGRKRAPRLLQRRGGDGVGRA